MDLEKFFKDNKNLYGKLAAKIVQEREQDFEDALQYLYLASLDMIPRFYDKSKSKLTTFVYNYVYKKALTEYRLNKGVIRIPHNAQKKVADMDFLSLDSKVHYDTSETWEDRLAETENKDFYNMEEDLYYRDLRKILNRSIYRMPERNRDIIKSYLIDENANLKELAKRHGISMERTRQIKEQSLISMRKFLKGKMI